MGAFIRYSIAVTAAFIQAVTASCTIIVFFILGFESWALLYPIAIALFIPLVAIAIWVARRLGRQSGS